MRLAVLLAALLVTAVAGPALGHPVDEIQGEALIDLRSEDARTFDLDVVLAKKHLETYTHMLRDLGLPQERDRDALHGTVARAFAFPPCAVQTPEKGLRSSDVPGALAIALHYRLVCPQVLTRLDLRRPGYKQARTQTTLYVTIAIAGRPQIQALVPPRMESLEIDLGTGESTPGERLRGRLRPDTGHGVLPSDAADLQRLPSPGQAAPWWQPPSQPLMIAWCSEGAWHLLTGWDHLLFLLTLVLAAARFRDLVIAVSAFSAGHLLAMTLALLLRVPAPPWLDVVIGATIALSAFRARRQIGNHAGKLALIAAGFGLIHGLGFGGGLQALTAGVDRLAWPVLAFGIGLDTAQLAWVTLAWTLWHQARRLPAPAHLARWQATAAWALVLSGLGAGVLAAVSMGSGAG